MPPGRTRRASANMVPQRSGPSAAPDGAPRLGFGMPWREEEACGSAKTHKRRRPRPACDVPWLTAVPSDDLAAAISAARNSLSTYQSVDFVATTADRADVQSVMRTPTTKWLPRATLRPSEHAISAFKTAQYASLQPVKRCKTAQSLRQLWPPAFQSSVSSSTAPARLSQSSSHTLAMTGCWSTAS
eukprot:SAG31_NODE_2916_length_4915_cov_43.966985_7_plen_185_part_01